MGYSEINNNQETQSVESCSGNFSENDISSYGSADKIKILCNEKPDEAVKVVGAKRPSISQSQNTTLEE